MAVSMKSLETELKVGKALSQIKELEKAFLRVSTNGVNPINKSLSQMNSLLRSARTLTGGLEKDFRKMAKLVASFSAHGETAATPKPSPKPSPTSTSPSRSLWQLAKSHEQARYRKSQFGSDQNKKLAADAEKAFMDKLGSSGFSPRMQGQIATMLPMLAKVATVAGATTVAIAGITAAVAGLAAGATLLAATFGGLGIKMIESEVQIAKLQTAFQSQTKATIEYQKAVLHASRTPFETDEVINAVVQMQVFQVNAFERIGKSGRQLVDILGDMAGATGTDLATATHALQRAMVGEWEIMQNNFQISARMIPKLKGLATGTAEYKKAIIDYLEQQGRFIGGQEIMAKSLRGMWSNIKDAATNLVTFTAGVADSKAELSNVTLYDKFRESLFGVYDAVSRPDVLNQYSGLIAEINAGGAEGAIAQEKLASAIGNRVQAEKLIEIANNKSIKTEYQRIQALKAAGFEEDQIYGRGQKIIAMGQMLGQIMKVIYTATFKPVIEGIGSGLDWILLKFESVGRMLSSDKIFDQSVVKNAEDAKRSLTQIALDVGQQWGISAETMAGGIEKIVERMGEGGKQFDKEIRERGIHTINGWQKAVMVFSILMEFVSLYVEDKMGGIFTLFKQLGAGFTEGFSFLTDGTFAALFDQFTNMITAFGITNDEVTGNMMGSWRAWGQVIGAVAGYMMASILVTTSSMMTFARVTWNTLQIVARLFTVLGELLSGNFDAAGETIRNIGGDFADIFQAGKDYANVLSAANEGLGKLMPNQEGVNAPDAYANAAKDKAQLDMAKGQKDNEKERKKDAEDQKKLGERQIVAIRDMGNKRVNVNVNIAAVEVQAQRNALLENAKKSLTPSSSLAEIQRARAQIYAAIAAENPEIVNAFPPGEFLNSPQGNQWEALEKAGFIVDPSGLVKRKDGTTVKAGGKDVIIGPDGLTTRQVGSFNLASDQAIFAHKGEMIIPAREAEYLRSMITPNDGFRQGASLAGAMIPAALGGGGSSSKTVNAPVVNQYFMGQSGSRAAVQLYGEAQNLAKALVSS